MAIRIVGLFVFIFGAYAYGYLVWLWLRQRTSAWSADDAPPPVQRHGSRITLAMFGACTLWFVLQAIVDFRALLGDPPEDDLLDLATLELVFAFPGLIFHAYLLEARSDTQPFDRAGKWVAMMWALYATGIGMAIYFPSAIFGLVPAPRPLGPVIGWSIGGLFTLMSICSLIVMKAHPRRGENNDRRRLHGITRRLFIGMIAIFLLGSAGIGGDTIVDVIGLVMRSTPLMFLLVSIYFENRIEFYDLVVKRGVLLMLSLLCTGGVLALTLGWMNRMPEGAARPWLFAVVLLPVAMFMPFLHDRVGRVLDRLWFGREFAPVEAVKHVLAAMQAAVDEPSLIAATETALSEIFRRKMVVLREHEPVPPDARDVITIPGAADMTVRFARHCGGATRPFLSEDVALLRSLGGVFRYMLENVRLQRKRLEQEQVAQELRLQTSRSELKALRAQINPHFLFNALNAIASLIHTDPARADAAVEQLAEVFRYTLRRSEQEWAPLDQELSFARAYLDVEQARFGKRLAYHVIADPAAGRAQVPAMLLQTLVENAVKHGISRVRGTGRIDIVTTRRNGRLRIEVRDTGPGPDAAHDPERRSGESFGLRSVRDRLHGHFGQDASLALDRDGDTTVAALELPAIDDVAPGAGAGS